MTEGPLDVFVGEWVLEARFRDGTGADGPRAVTRFEWVLDGRFLLQRTEIALPEAPDALSMIHADPEIGAYTQHYYDSRGVVRIYAMTLADGVWTLTRESADFTPLEFAQRYTGAFSADAKTIEGAWEIRHPGGEWEHDFVFNYHRAG